MRLRTTERQGSIRYKNVLLLKKKKSGQGAESVQRRQAGPPLTVKTPEDVGLGLYFTAFQRGMNLFTLSSVFCLHESPVTLAKTESWREGGG